MYRARRRDHRVDLAPVGNVVVRDGKISRFVGGVCSRLRESTLKPIQNGFETSTVRSRWLKTKQLKPPALSTTRGVNLVCCPTCTSALTATEASGAERSVSERTTTAPRLSVGLGNRL